MPALEKRVVRYKDLVPCFNAFVDTRTPGSEAKENFTVIGPGVSENEEQFVHIAEPHGYNIGGARQPPGCVNSQHSHKTAEVFLVHSGTWRFDFGEDGTDAQVVLTPGDVVSIPTDVFRGFTNVGDEIGYLYAVLGQDDPGRVTWAPSVFELAKEYGLILLESGRLVDTCKGQEVPRGARPMPPPGKDVLARMATVTPELAERFVWRADKCAEVETLIIGDGPPYDWPHGFTFGRRKLGGGERVALDGFEGSRVVFVQSGSVAVRSAQGELILGTGDTFSVPRMLAVDFEALSDAAVYVTTEDI
jgi:quercetin dioxygenase-like cupin family protein